MPTEDVLRLVCRVGVVTGFAAWGGRLSRSISQYPHHITASTVSAAPVTADFPRR
jgi:hypothetical protein